MSKLCFPPIAHGSRNTTFKNVLRMLEAVKNKKEQLAF